MFYESIRLLSNKEIGLGSQLKEWYQNANSNPFMFCNLKFNVPAETKCNLKTYVPAGIETQFLEDEYTIRLYPPNISKKIH